MQKTAQKRSVLNKILETANMSGASVENFFEPEMKRVMNSLREADDNIRTVLVGQKIGKATIDPPSDNRSLKDMLKSAKSNFNRREYMSGVADLGRFHKRMYEVERFIHQLRLDVEKIHNNFLFQGLNDSEKEKLKNLREHMSSFGEVESEYFIKSAGIMDFFYNIGTQRGRALAAWEKKYPGVARDIREGGIKLIENAENVLANTISLLKEMATARAIRKVDSYMDSARKIQLEYNKFDSGERGFRNYYTNIVQPWLKKFDEWEAARNPAVEVKEPAQDEELNKMKALINEQAPNANLAPPTPTAFELPSPQFGVPSNKLPPPPLMPNMPSSTAPTSLIPPPPMTPAPASAPPIGSEFKSEQLAKEMWGNKNAHTNFMKSLEKMNNEDPRILAGYISKYAKSIQSNDLETAIELFAIAKQLKSS